MGRLFLMVCLSVLPGVSTYATENSLRMAFVTDLQTNKTVWKEVSQGAQLAAQEFSKTDKAFKFELVDSGPGAVGTKRVMERLMKDPPDIVVAEIDSSKALVAAEIANKHNRVLITPFATSPRITEEFPYAFRACPSDAMIARSLSHFASSSLKAKKVAVVYDGGQLYSVTLKDAFEKDVISRGGEVVFSKAILSSSTSYADLVNDIVSKSPDVVFLPFYEETVGRFLSDGFNNAKFRKIPLLGGDGWAQVSFLSRQKNEFAREVTAYWVTHHNPKPNREKAISFVTNFRKKFKSEPQTSAAYLGYDAVLIGYKALSRFKTRPQQRELKDVLSNLESVDATTGVISFKGSNDPLKPIYLISHKNGKIDFEKEL